MMKRDSQMKQVLQQEGHTSYTAQDQRHADAQVLAKMTRMSPYRRNCKLEGTFYVSFDAGVPTHRPQTTRGKMKQKAPAKEEPKLFIRSKDCPGQRIYERYLADRKRPTLPGVFKNGVDSQRSYSPNLQASVRNFVSGSMSPKKFRQVLAQEDVRMSPKLQKMLR